MLFTNLCSPALMSLVLVIIYVMREMSNKQHTQALTKLLIGVMFTMLLQVFCLQNLKVIAWLLVFIPLIMYTYTTMIIFFVFGTNPSDRVKSYVVDDEVTEVEPEKTNELETLLAKFSELASSIEEAQKNALLDLQRHEAAKTAANKDAVEDLSKEAEELGVLKAEFCKV
jgi:DNA integrity scanning protein DisA with diadenylate cyclase activity